MTVDSALLAAAATQRQLADNAAASMQAAPALHPMAQLASEWLERLRCWVLDLPQPRTHLLRGQACDRLRPRFVAEALEQELQQRCGGSATQLVHWQWDSRTAQVSGLLLVKTGALQRFWWHPALDQFCTEPLLQLQTHGWLQLCCVPAANS